MDLFDYALSRQQDPETSRQAAQDIKKSLSVRRRQFLTALQGLVRATANEVAQRASQGNHGLHESIRKRAHELVRAGLIREAGAKTCEVTGREATVYEVTQ